MCALVWVVSTLLLHAAQAYAEENGRNPFDIDYHAKAAYFTFQQDGTTQYVFAMNPVANGDIHFHMSGPVAHSWLEFGFGSEMRDSFMILAYPSSNGLNTTISPRIGSGHTEPVYNSSFEIVKVYNDTYAPKANTITGSGTGTIISHALCLKCSRWFSNGKEHVLDTFNKEQQFIFALGPRTTDVKDDSLEASLPRHGYIGQFTMDMTQATNVTGWYGRVPAPNIPDFVFPPSDDAFASFASTLAFNDKSMENPLPSVHAILMCVTFVLVFPTGAVIMQFLKKALWHGAVQAVGFVMILTGFGVAVSFSKQYTKSNNFNSAHQAIGLIIVAALVIQLGLGLVHHSMYLKTQKPTPFGRVHFFLDFFIMLLGLINGGLGFNFANHSHLNIPYAVVVVIVAIVILGVVGCQIFCRSRRKYKPEAESQHAYSDYEMPRQSTFGVQPPGPDRGTMPYTPIVPAPYSPTTPYTPSSAYTPITPNTWKKEELTRWPIAPYKEYDDY